MSTQPSLLTPTLFLPFQGEESDSGMVFPPPAWGRDRVEADGTWPDRTDRNATVLRDEINNALKEAMKAGDKRRVSTLRLVNAEILKRETSAAERITLTDAEILDVMGKMIKQRQESLDIYEKAGRADLAAQEREEIEIISAYPPQQLSDLEAGHAISELIKELESATLKDMGRTMAALKARYAGRMDFSKASALVKKLLAG